MITLRNIVETYLITKDNNSNWENSNYIVKSKEREKDCIYKNLIEDTQIIVKQIYKEKDEYFNPLLVSCKIKSQVINIIIPLYITSNDYKADKPLRIILHRKQNWYLLDVDPNEFALVTDIDTLDILQGYFRSSLIISEFSESRFDAAIIKSFKISQKDLDMMKKYSSTIMKSVSVEGNSKVSKTDFKLIDIEKIAIQYGLSTLVEDIEIFKKDLDANKKDKGCITIYKDPKNALDLANSCRSYIKELNLFWYKDELYYVVLLDGISKKESSKFKSDYVRSKKKNNKRKTNTDKSNQYSSMIQSNKSRDTVNGIGMGVNNPHLTKSPTNNLINDFQPRIVTDKGTGSTFVDTKSNQFYEENLENDIDKNYPDSKSGILDNLRNIFKK